MSNLAGECRTQLQVVESLRSFHLLGLNHAGDRWRARCATNVRAKTPRGNSIAADVEADAAIFSRVENFRPSQAEGILNAFNGRRISQTAPAADDDEVRSA